MRKIRHLTAFALFIFSVAAVSDSTDYADMSVSELREKATEIHPSGLYMLATKLFSGGQKDEAVTWFYIGQLRFRYYLKANPNLDKSGDPALFSSLQYVVGTEINEYAGGSPDDWVCAVEKALEWDAANPNLFSPKEINEAAYLESVTGLKELAEYVKENKELIRKERTNNGLENR